MRELILIIVIAALCCVGVARPLVGLFGYVWFALLRPDILAWSYGHYPYSLALAVATVIGTLRYAGNFANLFTNPLCLLLLLLDGLLGVSVLVAQEPESSRAAYEMLQRVLLMAFLVPVLVTTERSLGQLVLLMGVSLGVLGTKFGLFGLLHGGVRFGAGYGGMIGDNNDLALALAMSLAPMWYLRPLVPWGWARMLMLFMLFCTVTAVVMTFSRGGGVTLGVVLLLFILRSRRKAGLVLFLGLLVSPVLYLMGDAYRERMSTIADPTQEASAYSRIALVEAGLRMWKDYPLFGTGFGMHGFASLLSRYTDVKENSVAHNTYLQMLVDSGILAFAVYLLLLWGSILWLGSAARAVRRHSPSLADLAVSIQVSLVAFAVGSAFLSRVHFDVLYLFLMAAASWWAVVRAQRPAWAAATAPADDAVLAGSAQPALSAS